MNASQVPLNPTEETWSDASIGEESRQEYHQFSEVQVFDDGEIPGSAVSCLHRPLKRSSLLLLKEVRLRRRKWRITAIWKPWSFLL